MSFGPSHPSTYKKSADRPLNYVPGLGRGAVGFTTRSDIGPARSKQAPSGYQAGIGRGAGGLDGRTKLRGDEGNAEGRDYSATSFNEFEGYSHSLFGNTPYDKEDKEADEAYRKIDEKMDSKRKARRECLEAETRKKLRRERPRIADQFADLKKGLSKLTEDDWMAIPEVGGSKLKSKKEDFFPQRSYPVPDSVIAGAYSAGATSNTIGARDMGGFKTPLSNAGWKTATTTAGDASSVLTDISQAREEQLRSKLDRMADSVSGQTVVDPKGYMTKLSGVKVTSEADIGDIKKARKLMRSVTQTNPKHGPGWIAYARLEEVAGRMIQARKIIKKACSACPKSEDVWIEAARLQTPEEAKNVFGHAIREIPRSVNIWIKAAKLESDKESQKAVLRRALEFVPKSVRLWKEAVSLHSPEDAKIMLGRAVECIPTSVDLWLALAHLETYDNARRVLNAARDAIATDQRIWIAAAKLEEANGKADRVSQIVKVSLEMLEANGVFLDRDVWLKEAEKAERANAPLTAASIVHATLDIGVEAEDRLRTYMDDASQAEQHGAFETARAIFAHALRAFPGKTKLWYKALKLEKSCGSAESVEELLKRAVEHVPETQTLWLMYAKHKWRAQNDVDGARKILEEAFKNNEKSEKIWLAAVKLEWENQEIDRARVLLSKARDVAPSARVWMKSALLEWEINDLNAELKLLEDGIARYSQYPKLWMMKGQALAERGEWQDARIAYHKGLNHNPTCVPLWQIFAKLETERRGVVKGRSILVLARLQNPKNEDLWASSVRLELEYGDKTTAVKTLAKGLQECPSSGKLWSMEIEMAPKKQRQRRAADALQRCDNNVYVIAAVAKNFWRLKLFDKARKWFNRAASQSPKIGDLWAMWYRFELENGDDGQQSGVLRRCVDAEPNAGDLWCPIAKQRALRHADFGDVLRAVAKTIPSARRKKQRAV
eukprot:g3489.t1